MLNEFNSSSLIDEYIELITEIGSGQILSFLTFILTKVTFF